MREVYYTGAPVEVFGNQKRESDPCVAGSVSPIQTTVMEGSNSGDFRLNLGHDPILHDSGNQSNIFDPVFGKNELEFSNKFDSFVFNSGIKGSESVVEKNKGDSTFDAIVGGDSDSQVALIDSTGGFPKSTKWKRMARESMPGLEGGNDALKMGKRKADLGFHSDKGLCLS